MSWACEQSELSPQAPAFNAGVHDISPNNIVVVFSLLGLYLNMVSALKANRTTVLLLRFSLSLSEQKRIGQGYSQALFSVLSRIHKPGGVIRRRFLSPRNILYPEQVRYLFWDLERFQNVFS